MAGQYFAKETALAINTDWNERDLQNRCSGGAGGGRRKREREKNKSTPHSSQVSIPSYSLPSTLAHPILHGEEPAKAHTSSTAQTEPGSPRTRGTQGVRKPAWHTDSALAAHPAPARTDAAAGSKGQQGAGGLQSPGRAPPRPQASQSNARGAPSQPLLAPDTARARFPSVKQKSARLFRRTEAKRETVRTRSGGDGEAPASKGGIRRVPAPSSSPPSRARQHGGCACTCQEGLTRAKVQGKPLLQSALLPVPFWPLSADCLSQGRACPISQLNIVSSSHRPSSSPPLPADSALKTSLGQNIPQLQGRSPQ